MQICLNGFDDHSLDKVESQRLSGAIMAIDDNETTEAPKAIKGVDKETVHRICSGQVNATLLSFLHMYSRFSIRSCVGLSLFPKIRRRRQGMGHMIYDVTTASFCRRVKY